MALKRKSIDRTTLPAALLATAKQHLRVDFTDDDTLIQQKLTAALDMFERLTSYGAFATTWEWTPAASDAVWPGGRFCEACNRCTGAAGVTPIGPTSVVPVMRVSAWTARNDTGDDIAASYELIGEDNPDTVGRQYLVKVAEFTGAPILTLTTGFGTVDDLPPGILDGALRVAAWLYEFREMALLPGFDDTPYANTWLTQYWVPRC